MINLRVQKSFCFVWAFVAALCFGHCFSDAALAQDIQFEASVNRTTVPLDGVVQLTLTASGTQDLEPMELPDIEGFQARYIGPSTRVSIVNGQYASSIAFIYKLFPQKTGTFTVPALTADIEGQSYTTQPITLTVVEDGSPAEAGQAHDENRSVGLDDKIFLVASSTEKTAYRHEAIPVTVRLLISGLNVRDITFPEIKSDAFHIEEFGQPDQYQKVLNGTRYSVVEFHTRVFPLESGLQQLGPITQSAQIVVRDDDRRGGGFFDDDFFSGFFNRYQTRPVTVQSEGMMFEVKDLPSEGRPAGFSGGVGEYRFTASVSPDGVKVGDPLTLKMTVSGNGDLSLVDMPEVPETDTFKVYQPEITTQGQQKVLEQVLIPKSAEVSRVPAVEFSFFDPKQGEYRTVSQGPFPVTVRPLEEGEQFSMVGGGPAKTLKRDEVLGEGIGFIKEQPGPFRSAGRYPWMTPLYWIVLVFILSFWGGGIYAYAFRERMRTDIRFARRMKAPSYARRGLREAGALLDNEQGREFYDHIYGTLQKYFEHKCHIPVGAVTCDKITETMPAGPNAEQIRAHLREVIDRCEAARYASAEYGPEERRSVLQRVQEIIDWFERHA
ncbi:MAG: BatD family protein [Candidatus Omnitrophota bacterium]